MTKINGDKPIFQYSHSCPIFSYCFCHSFYTDSAQDPLLPSSHFCPLWDMSTALLSVSLSQLPVLGRASWLEAGWAGQAQSQLPDQWQTAGKDWGTCWERLLVVLCRAAGRGYSCLCALVWKPSPAPRKAALLNSLPAPPLLAYTARTPQVLW